MSGEKITQNTSVTYSEKDGAIQIDINLTMSGNDVDVFGYIKALIDGQYPDTIQDMCDISIQEVNEASDMAYELGFHELPAHISCTIFIKDVPIAGAFQGISDDEPKVYYRIDEDKQLTTGAVHHSSFYFLTNIYIFIYIIYNRRGNRNENRKLHDT